MFFQLWLGVKPLPGSRFEKIYNWFRGLIAITRIIKEQKVKVAEGVELSYVEGKAVLKGEFKDKEGAVIGTLSAEVRAAYFANPKLDEVIAKVASGEIDLIPGTDLEKPVVLQVLQALKAEINR